MKDRLPAIYEFSDEMDSLVRASLGGDLSPEQAHRLEELICRDIDACDLYLNLLHEWSVLLAWAWHDGPAENAVSDGMANSCEETSRRPRRKVTTDRLLAENRISEDDSTSSVPLYGFLGNMAYSARGHLSSGWPMAYLIATVIFAIGLLIGARTYVSQPEQVVIESPTRVVPVVSPAVESVGRITGMVDCKWNDAEAAVTQNSRVSLGQKYALASGLMEITYNTGAKVILQGPVQYEIESKNGGFVSIGKLTGKVATADAKGFTVRTPTATVTDLGTEFGVAVGQDGVTETQVFVGTVRVAKPSDHGVAWGQTIHAGSAVRVDGGKNKPVTIPADAQRFTRTLPHSSVAQNVAADYAKRVLSMQPLAYYGMELPSDSKDRAVLFDSAPGAHHGIVHFNSEYVGEPYTSGRFGQSLRLRGPAIGDYAIVPDCPRAMTDRLTVSVWVYAMSQPSEDREIIATNRGVSTNADTAEQLQFTLSIFGNSRYLEGAVTEHDGKKVAIACEKREFVLGDWQHVALVADGTMLHLYRNGVEVASSPCTGVLPGPKTANLDVGCLANREGTEPLVRSPYYWQGRIDELAIFDRALSSVEIQQLFAGTRPQRLPDSVRSKTDTKD